MMVCALPLTSNVKFYLIIFLDELFFFTFKNFIETFHYFLFNFIRKNRQHMTVLKTAF